MRTEDIVKQLTTLTLELDQAVRALIAADEEMVYAQQEERQAYARTFMSLDGSIELRKQQTILDTSDEKLEAELTEARVRACRARIKYLEQAFDATRSISAARRAEFISEPTGQWS